MQQKCTFCKKSFPEEILKTKVEVETGKVTLKRFCPACWTFERSLGIAFEQARAGKQRR